MNGMDKLGSALLLGVFHSRKFDDRVAGKEPNRGQLFRDGVRSKALEDAGYTVRSLDDKHQEVVKSGDEIHCTANFADARRMSKALKSSFGESTIFDHIILDYFFSPIGWARERWTSNFWRITLPMLAENDLLKIGGQIWLPNLECVEDSINEFRAEIGKYYTIEAVGNPHLNPLYAATETVEQELLRCPDSLTNETQLRPLLSYSNTPFLMLTRREIPIAMTRSSSSSDLTPTRKLSKTQFQTHSLVRDVTPRNLALTEADLSSTGHKRRNLKKESTKANKLGKYSVVPSRGVITKILASPRKLRVSNLIAN